MKYYPNNNQMSNKNKNIASVPYGGKMTSVPDEPKLTMAYVPFQTDFNTYDEARALKAGTLFPCLDKPFLGSGLR